VGYTGPFDQVPTACVIIMDNATFYKRQVVKTAFANIGYTLEYLLSYFP
jgi:hypothetical protein